MKAFGVPIWNTKRTQFMLAVVLGIVGCARTSPRPPAYDDSCTLPPDFSQTFDRLFLSSEPLRYQDNEAFITAICPQELGTEQKALVKNKLIQFLSLDDWEREYAPDSIHTGVASEIAFLRLQTIQLLGEVGTKQDVEFARSLCVNPEGEHPLFEEACLKAVEQLSSK